MKKETVSVKEASQLLNVSNSWVYELIKRGDIELFNGRPILDSVRHYSSEKRPVGRPEGSYKSNG